MTSGNMHPACGVWRLARWEISRDPGQWRDLDCDGRLFYHPSGEMSGILVVHGKSGTRTDAYAGGWRIEGDQVFHDVRQSTYAGWAGTTISRTILSMTDSDLVLQTPMTPSPDDRDAEHRLHWQRIT